MDKQVQTFKMEKIISPALDLLKDCTLLVHEVTLKKEFQGYFCGHTSLQYKSNSISCQIVEFPLSANSQIAEHAKQVQAIKNIHFYPHPNFLHIFGYTKHDNGIYLVCEPFSSVILHQCNHIFTSAAKRADVVLQLVKAVHLLHDIDVVHGHINPQNVLIDHDSNFIIKRVLLCSFLDLNSQNEMKLYEAPELQPETTSTKASDIFALGMVLKFIFWNVDPHVAVQYDRDSKGEAELDKIVTACTLSDPLKRPTIEKVQADVQEIWCSLNSQGCSIL